MSFILHRAKVSSSIHVCHSSFIEQKCQAAFMCVIDSAKSKVSSSIHACVIHPSQMFSEKRATAATGATERQRLEQKASEERAMAATGATERQQQEPRKTSKSQKSKARRAKPATKRDTAATRATERPQQEPRKRAKASDKKSKASNRSHGRAKPARRHQVPALRLSRAPPAGRRGGGPGQ